jgi:hypothetical protein
MRLNLSLGRDGAAFHTIHSKVGTEFGWTKGAEAGTGH